MIPTLLIISVVAFWLARLAPGDPVECGNRLAEMGERNYEAYVKEYARQVDLKGLKNPIFYITLNSFAHPDTLQRVFPKDERELCLAFIQASGNWPGIQNWRRSIRKVEKEYSLVQDQLEGELNSDLAYELKMIAYANKRERVEQIYRNIRIEELPLTLKETILESSTTFQSIFNNTQRWKLWLPTFSWNGLTNQYHLWISKILKLDFGISCRNNQPAVKIIGASLKWTLMMTVPAILIAFLLAIPLGIYSGLHAGSKFDRWSSIVVFILFALPSFWVAILLLVFFSTPEYSSWLDWFPSVGLGRLPSSAPFWPRFWETSSHLILPIFCMVYSSLAFISRQMRSGVLNILPEQYIITAKAKGLGQGQITRKHILKNSLFPILTLAAGILPAVISGSVIIEFIFNIPGMGRTTLDAISSRDWPVVYAILFLGAGLTILGIFITDLLYAWADPRVKFKSSIPDTE